MLVGHFKKTTKQNQNNNKTTQQVTTTTSERFSSHVFWGVIMCFAMGLYIPVSMHSHAVSRRIQNHCNRCSLHYSLYSNSTCHTWKTFPLIFTQFFSSLNWQAGSYFLDYKTLNVYILLQLLTSLRNLSNISLEDLVCRLTQKLLSQMTLITLPRICTLPRIWQLCEA